MKQKRHLNRKREAARKRDTETSFKAPSYDFISNASCILTPEVSNGPYWLPASEVYRQDIRDGEVGVPLQLDIGVIDVNTCEPMEGVLISIWVSKRVPICGQNLLLMAVTAALQQHRLLQLLRSP